MRKKITLERDDSLDFLLDSRYRQEKIQKKLVGQLVILSVVGLLVLIFV
jgi:hypothetical protein